MCRPFKHLTGDHSKQLRPCSYMVQSYQFQLEILIVGKIPRSFPLTKPENSERIFCPLRIKAILNILKAGIT